MNQLPNGRTDQQSYISDPKQPHIAIMGEIDAGSSICSANKDGYEALNNDVWKVDQGDGLYPTEGDCGRK